MDTSEELGWVAAVLAPRLVAPHPNYFSKETITPYAAMALLTSARYSDFARLEIQAGGSADGRSVASLLSFSPLFDAIRRSATIDQVASGATDLAEIAQHGMENEFSWSFRTSCAVVAAVSLAETGRAKESYGLLLGLLSEAPTEIGTSSLLRAWLMCSLNHHAWDLGRHPEFLDDAVGLAEQYLMSPIETNFEMSLGTTISSDECTVEIGRLVLWSARSQAARAKNDWSAELDIMRESRPTMVTSAGARLADSLSKQVNAAFDEVTQSRRRTTTFGGTESGDDAIIETLLWHEYLGSTAAVGYRSLLGRSRFESGIVQSESWLIEEGLRLLSAARDHKAVGFAAGTVLRGGPLQALQRATEFAIASVSANRRATQVDLAVVKAGYSLLSDDIRDEFVTTLVEGRNQPPNERGWAGTHPTLFREETWRVVRLLATSLPTKSLSLAELLDDVVGRDSDADDYSYAGLLAGWERAAWLTEPALSRVSGARAHLEASGRTQILNALDTATSSLDLDGNVILDLDRVAQIVDGAQRGESVIAQTLRTQIESVLSAGLSATRRMAQNGMFSGGGTATADVAVAYAFLTPDTSIWADIVEFLLDPSVQRDEKDRATQRLARHALQIPLTARNSLKDGASDLISGGPSFFDQRSEAFPAGVRLLSALEMLDGSIPLELIGGLLAEGTTESAEEAASAVLALVQLGKSPDWLASTATWLTYHGNPTTRAIAGQALALVRSDWNTTGRTRRLQGLLEEDGVFVPLKVLWGLQSPAAVVDSTLVPVLESISVTHPSSVVRQAATEALRQPR